MADAQSLAVIPLLREPLWAVAPPDAGLTAQRPVPWAELLEQPLVLPVSGHGLRALIDQARSSLSAQPRIKVETNSMHPQKKLVLAGHGWTVLPAAGVADDVRSGVLSGAPLSEPEVSRSLVLALRRGNQYATPGGCRRRRAPPADSRTGAIRPVALRTADRCRPMIPVPA